MDATAYMLHIYRYNILPPPKESPSPGDHLRFFSRLSLPFMGLPVRLRRGPNFRLRLAGFEPCVESCGSETICCDQKKVVHLMDATAYTLHLY